MNLPALNSYFFRAIKVGPFHVGLFVTLLITTFVYKITKPNLPEDSESQKEERKWLLISIPWILVSIVVFATICRTTEREEERAFLFYLVLAIMHQIVPFYFIMTSPKLKLFAMNTCKSSFDNFKTLIGKPFKRHNQILPQ